MPACLCQRSTCGYHPPGFCQCLGTAPKGALLCPACQARYEAEQKAKQKES